MRLLSSNVIEKTNRLDRPTLILLILSETDKRLIVLDMVEKVSEKIDVILSRDNIYLQNYKLYDQIVRDSYDYIIQAEVPQENFVLFSFNGNERFTVSDFVSLGNNQQLTKGVIELILSDIYIKHSKHNLVVGASSIMTEAISIASKIFEDSPNSAVYEQLDKELIKFHFLLHNRALLPMCHNFHWQLLDVKMVWLGTGICEYVIINFVNNTMILIYFLKLYRLICHHYDSNSCTRDLNQFDLIQKTLKIIIERFFLKEDLEIKLEKIEITSITCPQQENDSKDCGLFLLKLAENIMMEKEIFNFNQNKCSAARQEIAEIVKKSVSKEHHHLLPAM